MAISLAKNTSQRLRIIVLGYVIRGPLGGMVWSNLHFLTGLARLGHDVYFMEDSDDYPSCYNPLKGYTDADPSYGLQFAARVFGGIGFSERWAYHDAHRSRWHGPLANRTMAVCHEADLVLNLCGVNPLRPWLLEVPHRAYVDEDPAFTQIRNLKEPQRREFTAQHTAFFTFGANFHSGRSHIPDDGFPWQPARQPVVLDILRPTPANPNGKFTSVMQWESYPGIDYNNRHYGMKSESFQDYLDLPAAAGLIFQLAVGGEKASTILSAKGWSVLNPLEITRDPDTYENFLRESKAEFGIAKHGYVVSRSGWFSERSAAYLASGRPVTVQETGFSDWLAVGDGVLSFRSREEALTAIDKINSHYRRHCEAAREIAEEFFDARKLLPPLLEKALHPAVKQTPTRAIANR